jgi:Resolvase, N terminal domain
MDRFIRNVSDLDAMIRWADKHGKDLLSATEPFDLRSLMGRAMAYFVGIFAEMESAATSERVTGAHAFLRANKRWPAGTLPYGYRVIPNPAGAGYVLDVDPVTSEIVREIVLRIIDHGHSVNSIAKDLNDRQVPTPSDWLRELAMSKPGADPGQGQQAQGSVLEADGAACDPAQPGLVRRGDPPPRDQQDQGRRGQPRSEARASRHRDRHGRHGADPR